MKRIPRPGSAGAGRAHHIDEVAHHFLSGEGATPPIAAPAFLDIAIAAPGPGRAAACAGAGLAVAAASAGWGSCLVEDETVAWSAFSFLGRGVPSDVPACVAADLPAGVRARRIDGVAPAMPGTWLRWRLLGEISPAGLGAWEAPSGLPAAARSAAPRWAALVWCASPHDAAAPSAQESLRRLVALTAPPRIEFLVLPPAWDARPGGWHLVGRRQDPGWRNLAHLQDVVRAAAGARPAAVRVLPDTTATGSEAAAILAEVVADLTSACAAGAAIAPACPAAARARG